MRVDHQAAHHMGPADPLPDLAARMMAYKRKTAQATRRPERPIPSPATPVPTQTPAATTPTSSRTPVVPTPSSVKRRVPARRSPSPEEYGRHAAGQRSHGRLFNPDVAAGPSLPRVLNHREREPEVMSESSSIAPPRRPPQQGSSRHASQLRQTAQAPARQLFDPSRDDPMRFSVLSRPQPTPPVGGYVSASSTSDSRSLASSAFTLSSHTSASSAGSGLQFQAKKEEPGAGNPFVEQLKKIYREISALEKKLVNESEYTLPDIVMDGDKEMVRVKGVTENMDERWQRLIVAHKDLAEADHNLLTLATNPNVPASVQSIPQRYNIPTRLWSIAFHRLLTSMRRASAISPNALEYLTDFIYYAYRFYSGLLEEPNLVAFRGMWLEALGDLASYRMAVAIHTANHAPLAAQPSTNGERLDLPDAAPLAARIDDSSIPSIGAHAAAAFDDEDERDTWRSTARNWYATGLKDTPGTGRLHHHIGMLGRDVDGEEMRSVYHLLKSLISSHPFDGGRESLLTFFSPQKQQTLSHPSAPAPSLFLYIHGLLFTRVDLDQVKPTLARFIERLELDGHNNATVDESAWIMMAVLAIGSILEYGKADGAVRRAGGYGGVSSPAPNIRVQSATAPPDADLPKRADSWNVGGVNAIPSTGDDIRPRSWAGDDDRIMEEPEQETIEYEDKELAHLSRPMQALTTDPTEEESPAKKQDALVFSLALNVTFTVLSHLIVKSPLMTSSTNSRDRDAPLNPFITIILTFLATMFKQPHVLVLFKEAIPWADLATFLTASSRRSRLGKKTGTAGGKYVAVAGELLPEDWCLKGLEWVGRRVYERGFWKVRSKSEGGSHIQGEMDVIIPSRTVDPGEGLDGIVEDEDEDMDWEGGVTKPSNPTPPTSLASKRWKRLRSATETFFKVVPGFVWADEAVVIDGVLKQKVSGWEEERRREEEEMAARKRHHHWQRGSAEMDVDDDDEQDGLDAEDLEEDGDDLDDSAEVRELKARRRDLRNLLRSGGRVQAQPKQRRPRPQAAPKRPALQLLPGYTVLVVDTNILLSSLSLVISLVECARWTIIIPLAVVTELDGISKNISPLGDAAHGALTYLIAAVPSHSTSLKVQTSKGNYLRNLSVRSEHIDFKSNANSDRTMDDLILRSTMWQAEHFVDRTTGGASSFDDDRSIASSVTPVAGTAKVVLLTFDRNLRLKARSRKLDAADEKDMAVILATAI